MARTIQEVIDHLDRIIEWARSENSRLGYFAALYRKVTVRVKEGIAAGRFEDGPRLERLDVTFANRYLDAFEDWRYGRPVTGSWRDVFEASRRWRPVILQHLVAGMNAHINLDLAIAAAEVSPGDSIHGLRRDFTEINNVLFDLMDEVAEALGSVSPWIWLLDKIGGRTDDELVKFSISKARALAWRNAEELALLEGEEWDLRIAQMDTVVETLGRAALKPGPLLSAGLMVIRAREESDTRRVLAVLTG